MSSQPSHKIKRVTPVLPVRDMGQTLDFYVDVLRFEVALESPDYSIVDRDGATIHFVRPTDESTLEAVRGRLEIYIEVDEIDSLWRHVRQYRDRFSIRDLFAQPYGTIEFHILDPDECLVLVGQTVPSDTSLPPV